MPYLLGSKCDIFSEIMSRSPHPLEHLLAKVLAELGQFQVLASREQSAAPSFQILRPNGQAIPLEVKEFKRITPATAESACLTLKKRSEATGAQALIYAAIVSDRTSEIATKHGISWLDYAGNCRLVFPQEGIYIRQSGIDNPFGKQVPKVLNVFSSKSSRVVRAMLQEPSRKWQLLELAKHPDVRVSPGLMSRIKQSLVEDNYAILHEGRLCLSSPADLLEAWAKHYSSHKPQELSFYMRGDPEEVEQQVAKWCADSGNKYALSRFSAAWRLAPETRYNLASILVTAKATLHDPMQKLAKDYGAKAVDSGANLILQIADDESYFSNKVGDTLKTTSPLQTYLDLMAMNGRAQEAAAAIYDKYFKQDFMEAANRSKERHEGN